MAYTRAWDETYPAGSAQANTIDTLIQEVKTDLRERLVTAFGLTAGTTDFDDDPFVVKKMAFAQGTITADAQVLSMTATWNNAAVTFTAVKLNVTNTASNAASKLIDLQVGGVSQFSVTRAGVGTLTGALAIGGALTGVTTITTSGAINGQTISATANFTGSVTVANGLTVSAGTTAVQALTATTLTASSTSTLQDTVTIGTTGGAATMSVNIQAAAGQTRQVTFRSGSSARWAVRATNAAESGSNAGTDFNITAFDDTGATIDVPVSITRAATGLISLTRSVSQFNAGQTISGLANIQYEIGTTATEGTGVDLGGAFVFSTMGGSRHAAIAGRRQTAATLDGYLAFYTRNGGVSLVEAGRFKADLTLQLAGALTVAGSTTLGGGLTATTGVFSSTVSMTSYAAVGGSTSSDVGFYVRNTSFGAVITQYGMLVRPTFTSDATSSVRAAQLRVGTAAAAFTVANAYTLLIEDASKGAGSTITQLYGVFVGDITAGGTNYALYTGLGLVRFGDNVSCTGDVAIGSTLAVTGQITGSANIIAGTSSIIGWASRGGIAGVADGVWVMRNNAGTDFSRLQFGGTTSSFPALARNGTAIQAVLADGSSATNVMALAYEVQSGSGSTPTSGGVRFKNNISTTWRNAANSGNHTLALNGSDLFAFSAGLSVTGGATFSTGVTVSSGGVAVTGDSTIAGNLFITKTTEQLRVRYDASHYLSVSVDDKSGTTFAVAGGVNPYYTFAGAPVVIGGGVATLTDAGGLEVQGELIVYSTSDLRSTVTITATGIPQLKTGCNSSQYLSFATSSTGSTDITAAGTTPTILLTAPGAGGKVTIAGDSAQKIAFFAASGAAKTTVSGSRGGNAALQSLLSALAGYGLVTDSSTA